MLRVEMLSAVLSVLRVDTGEEEREELWEGWRGGGEREVGASLEAEVIVATVG